jgi:protein TonB
MPDLPQVAAFAQNLARQSTVSPNTKLTSIRRPDPRYPRVAERKGIEGSVNVEFTVAPDGRTRDVVVRESTPPVIFDKAAVEAVSQWVFEPVVRDGEAVSVRTNAKIQFSMKQEQR